LSNALTIARILHQEANQFSSIVDLRKDFSGTVDEFKEGVHKYFTESDQIKTHCNFLTFPAGKCLGYLVQIMPGASEKELDAIHEKAFANAIWPILSAENSSQNLDYGFIKDCFKKVDIDVELFRYPIDFLCRCNKNDYKQMLLSFDKTTLEEMRDKHQNVLNCMYCNEKHVLLEQDFEELIKARSSPKQ